MKTLIIIPARAGSKGLPNKNIKKLGGKPLISYTIDFALSIKKDQDSICVTTNDIQIIDLVKDYPKITLIKRPLSLSKDDTGMNVVLIHALNTFKNKNIETAFCFNSLGLVDISTISQYLLFISS